MEQTPTPFRRAEVFSYAGEFLSNERERVGFPISTPAESNRLRRNYRYLSLLHLVSPSHAIFLFYFSFFYILFYIFLCILNLVDGLLLVHSIFGTQHERADKIAMFLHNTTPTTLLVLLYANTGVPVLLSALPSPVVKTRCCISWRLLLFLWYMKA